MSRTADPIIIAAEPQLFVSDIGAALAFYVDRLGFTLALSYGEPPFYAQVRRGGARLNLRLAEASIVGGTVRAREPDALSATIAVDGIEALSSAYESAGVEWHQRLQREAWGARTFIVRDPDGNLIAFAGD
jgi:catechol 2,3-dioxygenase-like lactoylglutathione lyase family enzyme